MALDLRPYFASHVPGGTSGGPQLRPADTAAGVMAGALAQVAEATDLLAEEEATRTADMAYLDAVKATSDFKQGLRQRQDHQAFVGDYDGFWRQHKAKALGGLSGRARRKIESKLAYLEVQGRGEVQNAAWHKQAEVGRADMLRAMDGAGEVWGADAFSPAAQEAHGGLLALYANAAATGLIGADQAEDYRQKADERYAIAQVTQAIEADPYRAKKALAAGQWNEQLQPETKTQLAGAIDREIRAREAEARQRAAAENAIYLQGFEDEIAFLRAGQTVADTAYTRDELVRRLGAEKGGKLADEYDRALQYGADYAELATASPAEADKIFAGRGEDLSTPKDFRVEAAEFSTLRQVWDDIRKERADDPAGYAIRHDPAVSDAFTAWTAAMESGEGVAEATKSYAAVASASIAHMTGEPATDLLPAAAAAAVVKAYNGAGSAEEKLATVAAITTSLGDDQAAQAFWRQIEDGGIPSGFDVALDRWQEGNRGAAIRIATVLAGPEVKLEGDGKKNLAAALATTYDPGPGQVLAKQAALMGSPETWQQSQSRRALVGRVAALDMAAGESADAAVARAMRDVTGGAQPLDDSSLAAVMIPANAAISDVQLGLSSLRANMAALLTAEDVREIVGLEGEFAEQEVALFLEDLAREGRWVNHGDGFALAMPSEVGMSLATRADGSVVSVTMNQVLIAAARAAAEEEGLFYKDGVPRGKR